MVAKRMLFLHSDNLEEFSAFLQQEFQAAATLAARRPGDLGEHMRASIGLNRLMVFDTDAPFLFDVRCSDSRLLNDNAAKWRTRSQRTMPESV